MAKKPNAPKPTLKIIAEGDSWFNLPDFYCALPIVGGVDYDVVRGLQDLGHNVTSVAKWGHTIAQMAADRDWRGVLQPGAANLLILSGGGNDLLGTKFGNIGLLRDYLRQKPSAADPPSSYYLMPEFDHRLDEIMLNYRRIIADINGNAAFKKTKIIVHGYDYAQDKTLAWIGEPMDFRMIPEHRRAGIIKIMIDRFNARLTDLAASNASVSYLNLRNTVGQNRWHDEIHPTKAGLIDIAKKFEAHLLALKKK
jgi:hypothetical protein